MAEAKSVIEAAFDQRDAVVVTKGEIREAVDYALQQLDRGEVRG